ncbi:hypothetical protein BDQ12DRAFT_714751 [Crucibulum laeve]|uniref:BRCT domain-containing protein n=1 Tax=Crucibulum laeve TaxID=68775 RepID=A0A5C3LRS9_9AGAR|nr:hypothetical protein BDQ12DRAFT_714751 [Crucibulum laeve]
MPLTFAGVRYHLASCLSISRVNNLRHALNANGSTEAAGLEDETLTHVVTDSHRFEGWEVVEERNARMRESKEVEGSTGEGDGGQKQIHIITDTWVEKSIIHGKMQPEETYSADPSMLFSGVVACATELPPTDLEVLSAGITALGGQWRTGLTKDVTHLFAIDCKSSKYATALHYQEHTGVKVLLPHWFDDAVRLGTGKLETKVYEWPAVPMLSAGRDDKKEKGKKYLGEPEDPMKKTLYSTAALYTASFNASAAVPVATPAVTKQVWGGRKFVLGRSLELYARRREAVQVGIERAGGVVVRYEGDEEPILTEFEEEEFEGLGADERKVKLDRLRVVERTKERHREAAEAAAVEECDVFVTRWRNGKGYLSALRAHKMIGTLAWLYNAQSTGILTSPLDQLLHYPVPKRSIEGFAGHEITVTNYTGEAREYLKKLITAMGASFTPNMSGKNTVLIAANLSGIKAEKAFSWSIPVVNHTWLEDCFVQWRNLTVGLEKYVVFPPGVDFSKMLGERGISTRGVELLEEAEAEVEAADAEVEVMDVDQELELRVPNGSGTSARDALEVSEGLVQSNRDVGMDQDIALPVHKHHQDDLDVNDFSRGGEMDVDMQIGGWNPEVEEDVKEEEVEEHVAKQAQKKGKGKGKKMVAVDIDEEEEEGEEGEEEEEEEPIPKAKSKPKLTPKSTTKATSKPTSISAPKSSKKESSKAASTAAPKAKHTQHPTPKKQTEVDARPSKAKSTSKTKSPKKAVRDSSPLSSPSSSEEEVETRSKKRPTRKQPANFIDDEAGASGGDEEEEEEEENEALKRKQRNDTLLAHRASSTSGSEEDMVPRTKSAGKSKAKGKGKQVASSDEEPEPTKKTSKKTKVTAKKAVSSEEEDFEEQQPITRSKKAKKPAVDDDDSDMELVEDVSPTKKLSKTQAKASSSSKLSRKPVTNGKGKSKTAPPPTTDEEEPLQTDAMDVDSATDAESEMPEVKVARKRLVRRVTASAISNASEPESEKEAEEAKKSSSPPKPSTTPNSGLLKTTRGDARTRVKRKSGGVAELKGKPKVLESSDEDHSKAEVEKPAEKGKGRKNNVKLVPKKGKKNTATDEDEDEDVAEQSSPVKLRNTKAQEKKKQALKKRGKATGAESAQSETEPESEEQQSDSPIKFTSKAKPKVNSSPTKALTETPNRGLMRMDSVLVPPLVLSGRGNDKKPKHREPKADPSPSTKTRGKEPIFAEDDSEDENMDPETPSRLGRTESIRVAAGQRPKTSAVRPSATPIASASTSKLKLPAKAKVAAVPRDVDESSPVSSLSAPPPRRGAAARASQKLRDEIMPDVMNFEQQMRKSRKSGGGVSGFGPSGHGASLSAGRRKRTPEDEQDEERETKKRKMTKKKGKGKTEQSEDDNSEPPVVSAKAKRGRTSAKEEVEDEDLVSKEAKKAEPKSKKGVGAETLSPAKSPKKSSTVVNLMTTQVSLSDDVTKALAKLGVKIVNKPQECTHLVAKGLVRTEKFICAVSSGAHVLSAKWATDSALAKRLLPEEEYPLIDKDGENKYNLVLTDALEKAKHLNGKLFDRKTFYVTPKIPVDIKLLKNVVTACGGQVSTTTPTARILAANPDRHVISCPEDIAIWRSIAAQNYPIYSQELILTSALRQDINWDDPTFRVRT